MATNAPAPAPRIVVLGCGDVGSAVAHRLFVLGADVVLADDPRPPHPRRGMAFTDAWFDGTATLEGVSALLAHDTAELAALAQSLDVLPCTDAPWADVVAAWRPDVLVDARMRKRDVPPDLRAHAPTVVGLGPGFTPGVNCTLAVETAWGEALGDASATAGTSPLAGEPRRFEGLARERFVYAPAAGLWRTAAHIGDRVAAGQPVGDLGSVPVAAPVTGALRGLTRDGVPVRAGQKIVEVDPRAEPDVRGLGLRPAAIARGVARAVGLGDDLAGAFFGFEASMRATLDCIPMSMRLKLDRCGLKLSLAQWRALPRVLRELLLEAPVDDARSLQRLDLLLQRAVSHHAVGHGSPQTQPRSGAPDAATVPAEVARRWVAEHAGDLPPARWAALTPLQRYALLKLAAAKHGRNWPAAVAEFGLVDTAPTA
ncbi:hypothetical protein MOJ79_10485 [Calidifontimicrobium sp. SYSU G02091]|uniref:nitrate reductase associated protein n=1 Tax=Calidifontimicrobium sp. SYSU G02091 TaxID=2926421 RepID=UPI001F53617B|nr:nitrate reductase associated protein [Calidifontimicrobium sp. SYSU G02091]MCI1192269.1 hypothetical protein [Calidifontimicrobium sp. SYSU G02091]